MKELLTTALEIEGLLCKVSTVGPEAHGRGNGCRFDHLRPLYVCITHSSWVAKLDNPRNSREMSSESPYFEANTGVLDIFYTLETAQVARYIVEACHRKTQADLSR